MAAWLLWLPYNRLDLLFTRAPPASTPWTAAGFEAITDIPTHPHVSCPRSLFHRPRSTLFGHWPVWVGCCRPHRRNGTNECLAFTAASRRIVSSGMSAVNSGACRRLFAHHRQSTGLRSACERLQTPADLSQASLVHRPSNRHQALRAIYQACRAAPLRPRRLYAHVWSVELPFLTNDSTLLDTL